MSYYNLYQKYKKIKNSTLLIIFNEENSTCISFKVNKKIKNACTKVIHRGMWYLDNNAVLSLCQACNVEILK